MREAVRLAFLFCIMGSAGLSATGPSVAKDVTYDRMVSSGKSARLDGYFGWNADCTHKPIDLKVVDKPDHGTLTPRVESQIITGVLAGKAGKCMGKKTRSLAIYYRSANGYRGRDRFTVRISAKGLPSSTITFRLVVR